MNDVVTIREFSRNIYNYLKKDGNYTVSVNGKPSLEVVVEHLENGAYHGTNRDKIRKQVESARGISGHCFYCGIEIDQRFHIDHIEPRSKGGKDEIKNYAITCPECNRAKHDISLDDFIKYLLHIRSDKFKNFIFEEVDDAYEKITGDPAPARLKQSVVTTIPKTVKQLKNHLKKNTGLSAVVGKYACGCKRGETKLCPKHHRS
jgi:hypothetical protein